MSIFQVNDAKSTVALLPNTPTQNLNLNPNSISIGSGCGLSASAGYCVNIGFQAGYSGTQGGGNPTVAIGLYAGSISQSDDAIAIGQSAGNNTQGNGSVAIGGYSGSYQQGQQSLALGYGAGRTSQGQFATSLGYNSGNGTQGTGATSCGYYAGNSTQGNYAIALGYKAGQSNQHANSIVINASGTELDGSAAAGYYVNPIRSVAGTTPFVMAYDTTNHEVVATAIAPDTIATVTTTNATVTTLATIAIASNSVLTLQGKIAAADATYANACGGTFSATVVNAAGTLTLPNTPFVVVNSTSTATFNVVISGTNLLIQVTGIASDTYNWKAQYNSTAN